MNSDSKQVDILGVSFSNRTLKETIEYLRTVLDKNEHLHIITANPEIVMQINREPVLKSISEKSFITADGIGIVKGANLLGHDMKERVTGVELLEGLLSTCEGNYSVFLLGANEETSLLFDDYLKKTYPNLKVVGRRNGFFELKDDSVVKMVKEAAPDFLIMAMGSPRSHIWLNDNKHEFNLRLSMDVGGGFDSLTGQVKRAPQWIQNIHMEWFYRLIQNPSRKGRQMDLYRYLGLILKEKFKSS